MESLPALWLGAAVVTAVSAIAGFGEINLALAGVVLFNLLAAVRLHRSGRPKASVCPLLLTQALPAEPALAEGPAEDRFGGIDPDRLQLVLVRKMMLMERHLGERAQTRP